MSSSRLPQLIGKKSGGGASGAGGMPYKSSRHKPCVETSDDCAVTQVSMTIEGLNGTDLADGVQLPLATLVGSASVGGKISSGSSVIASGQVAGGTAGDRSHLALTPDSVLRQYGGKLSAFENKEVLSYPEIYFIGLNAKKKPGVTAGGINNGGYDDDQGCYINVCHDHMAYRYELLKVSCGSVGWTVSFMSFSDIKVGCSMFMCVISLCMCPFATLYLADPDRPNKCTIILNVWNELIDKRV